MTTLNLITPFRGDLGNCLSIGQAPSQGLVYAIDNDVVVKVPFQYLLPDEFIEDDTFYLEYAVRSFVAMERELAVYNAVDQRSYSNIARRLTTSSSACLFLERLRPLKEVWKLSDKITRHRWVRDLCSATSLIEELGFTQGDLAVRNLGVDSSMRLKTFDFGSAITQDHEDYAADVKRDHFGLATCLHYILTGIDPYDNVNSAKEVRHIEIQLLEGRGNIEFDAEILKNVIQAGWTGRAGLFKFSQVRATVEETIGTTDLQGVSETPENIIST